MTRSRGSSLLVTSLVIAVPILMGARGCGDDVPIGGCDEAACGPAPGAPSILCADGSIGGNTGECAPDAAGTCGWVFRDCAPPPRDCTDAECGAAPLTPLPSHCERAADGLCYWVTDDPGACDPSDCGPAPGLPSWTCADGTVGGFTGRCERDPATASCEWVVNECPMSGECDVSECGPSTDGPECTCADGTIGCNTGRCLRDADGTCGWEWRECPSTIRCGGFTPEPTLCPSGTFCAWPEEGDCGAHDSQGTCTRTPDPSECAVIDSAPVCGCDGMTYDNECYAWAASTSAARAGSCDAADCDTRQVLCEIVEPTCPAGETATQVGICYGPCVPFASCAPLACSADSDCPDPTRWACRVAADGTGTCVGR